MTFPVEILLEGTFVVQDQSQEWGSVSINKNQADLARYRLISSTLLFEKKKFAPSLFTDLLWLPLGCGKGAHLTIVERT